MVRISQLFIIYVCMIYQKSWNQFASNRTSPLCRVQREVNINSTTNITTWHDVTKFIYIAATFLLKLPTQHVSVLSENSPPLYLGSRSLVRDCWSPLHPSLHHYLIPPAPPLRLEDKTSCRLNHLHLLHLPSVFSFQTSFCVCLHRTILIYAMKMFYRGCFY